MPRPPRGCPKVVHSKRKRESGAIPELSRSGNLEQNSPTALRLFQPWEAAKSRKIDNKVLHVSIEASGSRHPLIVSHARKSEYLPDAPKTLQSATATEIARGQV